MHLQLGRVVFSTEAGNGQLFHSPPEGEALSPREWRRDEGLPVHGFGTPHCMQRTESSFLVRMRTPGGGVYSGRRGTGLDSRLTRFQEVSG